MDLGQSTSDVSRVDAWHHPHPITGAKSGRRAGSMSRLMKTFNDKRDGSYCYGRAISIGGVELGRGEDPVDVTRGPTVGSAVARTTTSASRVASTATCTALDMSNASRGVCVSRWVVRSLLQALPNATSMAKDID